MKIAVIGTRGIPHIMGGVETHCEQLYPLIAAKGADVTVFRRKPFFRDSLPEWKGVKLLDIKKPKVRQLEVILYTLKAVKQAKRLGADIVHIHAVGPGIAVPYAKMLGLKVVFTHHGPDYDREKWGPFAKLILKAGEWSACRYADHIIVISDVIRNIVRNKYGRTDGVSLIRNGVVTSAPVYDEGFLSSLGIGQDGFILSVCRFMPEKRLADLIKAYSELLNAGRIPRGVKLVLAGDSYSDDSYSIQLKSMAKSSGVILPGYVQGDYLSSLYSNCACFVLPSSHEGLPIALLEAMSFSSPVVVSDIPAHLEMGLEKDCYFHCGDIESLKTTLLTKLNNAQRPVKYSLEEYDWNAIADQVYGIYVNLIHQ